MGSSPTIFAGLFNLSAEFVVALIVVDINLVRRRIGFHANCTGSEPNQLSGHSEHIITIVVVDINLRRTLLLYCCYLAHFLFLGSRVRLWNLSVKIPKPHTCQHFFAGIFNPAPLVLSVCNLGI